jgi:peptide deformylase
VIRDIVKYPDPRLRQVAVRVTQFVTKKSNTRPGELDLLSLSKDLTDTMWDANGLGLAACQIGDPRRVIAIRTPRLSCKVVINPVFLPLTSEERLSDEGCLSIPGKVVAVKRWKRIMLEGRDIYGRRVVYELSDEQAACAQHEIDHLNGKLIIDGVDTTPKPVDYEKEKAFLENELKKWDPIGGTERGWMGHHHE